MKNLKTLVAMQLKDKINLSFLKSKKQSIFKIVLSILKFVIVTAVFYFAFYIIDYLNIVEPNKSPGLPQSLFIFIFSVMLGLSIIFCTFGLVKSLYISKDNAMLLVMPTSRTTVFISKIIVYYTYELIKNLTYYIPLFLSFGIINALPFYYYLWLIVGYFILTAIPVAIGALLSIPMVFILNFIRQYKWLELTVTTLVGAGLITLVVVLINMIPENIDLIGTWGTTVWDIHKFLNWFISAFYPLTLIVYAIMGIRKGITNIMFNSTQILAFLGCVLVIAVIIALAFVIVKPLFFKMASSPFEYRRVERKRTFKNKKLNSFWTGVKKEFILSMRTQEKFNGFLIILIGMPIAILLLNTIFAAMNTRLAGLNMSVAFNILIILLFALSSNCNLAHIYSEEGASVYTIKTNPKSYLSSLFSKLVVSIIIVTISIAVTVVIFSMFAGYNFLTGLLVFIMIEGVYLSHMLMSAEYDIMKPQTAHYQTTGGHISNPNDLKSSLMSIILSGIFAFLTYFFISESTTTVWLKVLVFVIGFLALRIWLYVNKIKVYYKEKC